MLTLALLMITLVCENKQKSYVSTGFPLHYDLPRAKIILGFLAQKLPYDLKNAKQSDIFKYIVKLT